MKLLERELIQNVFDFDNRVARQVMIPRVKMSMIKADTSIAEAVNIMLKEGYSRYPLYETSKDEIIGVVHTKDIVSVHILNNGKSLKDIMRPVHFIPETKPIDVLLRDFQRTKAQMAFVVSEFGGIIGLVTLEDILEELVGEIQDEHDQEQQIVIPVDKQTYHIAAQSSLHDINKLLEVPFPEAEEYETLAGLITFERPNAKEGEEFILFNYKIKVLKITQTLPEQVEVKLQEDLPQD